MSRVVTRYDEPVIAIGGGSFVPEMLKPLLGRYPVVAADGGADIAASLGEQPDLIVGDFDSITSPESFPSERLLRVDDQNKTDLEKTLEAIRAPLCLGFGFLGRRLDHSLAALHALSCSANPVVLVGRHDAVTFTRGVFTATLPDAARLSIWPLTRLSFRCSSGLLWPLDGLTLEAGRLIGTSNRVATDSRGAVSIEPESDDGYFVMVESRYWSFLPESIGVRLSDQAAHR